MATLWPARRACGQHGAGAVQVEEAALGGFHPDLLRQDAAAGHVLGDHLQRTAAADVFGGEVDRDVRAAVGHQQLAHVAHHVLDHQVGDVGDHAGLFGQRNEQVRPHLGAIRALPAHQRLGADADAGIQFDDRLVMQVQLAAADGGGQLAAQRQAAPRQPDHQAGPGGGQQQAERHVQPGLLAEGGGQRGARRGGDRQPFLVARGGVQRVVVQALAGVAQQCLQQVRIHAGCLASRRPSGLARARRTFGSAMTSTKRRGSTSTS
jgi:hypothetical protein